MGRYYNGDIEGKFWVGVQSSNDASFFGGTEYEPSSINYSFTEDDMPDIEKGITKCLSELGEYKDKLDAFFKGKNGYNDEMIMKEFNITKEKTSTLLEYYARLELGEKIRKCVAETGQCNFDAEL